MLKELLVFVLMVMVGSSQSNKPVYTKVTFLYDIKRGELGSSKRSFEYYLSYFEQLLQTDVNLIVFGDKKMEEFVWRRREQHNTVFVLKELSQFQNYWFANLIEKARQDILQQPNFPYKSRPQYAIKQYNLLMFGKLQAMTEAVKYDKWNTDYLLWTDGGMMHHFSKSIISPQNVVKQYYRMIQPQWSFPTYDVDIYFGYKDGYQRYIDRKLQANEMSFAFTFGGTIHIVTDIKNAFANVARITLENGDLNSDESILTLIPAKYPFIVPTTTNLQLSFNYYHVYGDDNKNFLNPRYFQAKIDLEGKRKMVITSGNQKVKSVQTINRNFATSLLTMKAGIQAQKKVFQPILQYKRFADKRMIKRKMVFLGLLWIVIIILFVQNIKMKLKINQGMTKI